MRAAAFIILQPFNRGSKRNFIMTTDEPLGELMTLCVWHDNQGKSPSWLLDKVSIVDQFTKKR